MLHSFISSYNAVYILKRGLIKSSCKFPDKMCASFFQLTDNFSKTFGQIDCFRLIFGLSYDSFKPLCNRYNISVRQWWHSCLQTCKYWHGQLCRSLVYMTDIIGVLDCSIVPVLNFDSLSVPCVSNRTDAFLLPGRLNEGAQGKG